MEKIDYVYLRTIQNNEKEGMELTKVYENFYTDASSYIKMLKENNERNPSLISIREYENARKTFEEIVRIRIKKIVLNVLQLSEPPKNILKKEKELYDIIKDNVIKFKNNLFIQQSTRKMGEKIKTEGFKKVKILKDIPQYRGSDGNMYGPYKKGTSISVPVSEADFLILNNMAE